ncbi:MAG TPA: hypothetical protein VGP50_08750, partial [Stellaceae bacterium]|nr:hypothetical protein [Stellaceae bacterium]
SPVAARVAVDALGMTPRNYGHLVMMAARYARERLDGHAVVNRQTRAPVMLDWERGRKNATAPGIPPLLLLAVPAIPAMLAAGALSRRAPAATALSAACAALSRLRGGSGDRRAACRRDSDRARGLAAPVVPRSCARPRSAAATRGRRRKPGCAQLGDGASR